MQSTSKYPRKTPRREGNKASSSSDSDKLRDPVNVFCRLRNLKDDTEQSCVKLVSPNILCLSTPVDNRILRRDMHYVFKHIFTAASTQREVFEHVAYPLLQDLLAGKNGLLFTYGVTGSGKTYTLTGEQNNPGVMPRCIDTLFNTISHLQSKKFVIKSDRMNGFDVQTEKDAEDDCISELRANRRTPKPLKKANSETNLYTNDGTRIPSVNENNLYAVFISYIEIYNNVVFDLLDDSGGKVLQSKILREDVHKNMYVNNVVEVEVKSSLEAFELFNAGQRRKRMGHTVLNSESSRSHSIFNIRLVQLEQQTLGSQGELVVPERNFFKVGQLSLVDLAGSERCSRTQNTGQRLKEASSINNSLMSLRTCLEILRDNQLNSVNRLVPYRDSRLTLLFKNYFEGQGVVQMIVCVNPSVEDYEENLQVMKFAEMTQDVKVSKGESRYTPYRKMRKITNVQITPSSTAKAKTMAPVVLGPVIPSINLNFDDLDACISPNTTLIKVLKARLDKNRAFRKEGLGKKSKFRNRLIDTDQKYAVGKSEIRSIKALFKKEQEKSQNLEAKVLSLETINDNMASKVDELQNVIRSLQCTIDEKDLKINQNLLEKERSKRKLDLQKEKMRQEVDQHLRRQREELHAQMHMKDIKLRKVRQIIDNDTHVDCPHLNIEAEVQTDVQTPENLQKNAPYKNNNVGNSRRRSRSIGEIWLEHNAVKPVALGTVFQPAMKRRKSVTKLSKASDVTNPKQSKYCLITQAADNAGDIETKLYKGDIVPTCGGGAQVIFNDVERLRQESPSGTPTGQNS